MITVDLGDGMILEMEEKDLEGPFYHWYDDERETTEAVEWKLAGKVVHRSVHVTLKQGLGLEALLGKLN